MANILTVDDDVELQSVMQTCLEAAGYSVSCALQVDEAETVLAQKQIDLLILDWDMPGTNGIEFCKHLRFNGFSQPILMVTGHTSDDDHEFGVDSGVDDYLTKPFKVKELMTRVKALLRRVDMYEFKLVPGARLGNIELLHELGKGGMGLVWRGLDKANNREVAVKFLDLGLMVEEGFWRRFQLEAQALGRLRHPNIVSLLDYGTTPGNQPYIVMEMVEGLNLVACFGMKRDISIKKILQICLQACEGLSYVHKQGLLHRDLKPSNLMVTSGADGHLLVKLVDFGLAKEINPSQAGRNNLTQVGQFFGTATFMSPEQGYGVPQDQRSDIYSFGCLLYNLICKEPPFDADDAFAVLQKHMSEIPMAMKQRCPELDLRGNLDGIVMKCLAKKPDQRYQNMELLAKDLEECLKAY